MPEETQSQETQSQSQSGTDESAATFWKEHETRTRKILDSWLEDKTKEHKSAGTSRTGGRPTLPGIIADMMFGKENK